MSWFKVPPFRRCNAGIESASDVIASQAHIKVYDDFTGEFLSSQEITQLEELAEAASIPLIIDSETDDHVFTITDHSLAYLKCRTKKGTVRKTRLSLATKLKRYVLSRSNGICEYCGVNVGKHIHHINGKPHENDKDNLMLLCQTCHIFIHKEMLKDNTIVNEIRSKIIQKNTEFIDEDDEF
ncbi:MAG: hypothetical protein CV087_22995 [Candidatus Brocadia sp. WS118]|nr:MAG: hypothetical protein CV087_22995 [Candidatus Brocadia sp. WS118]